MHRFRTTVAEREYSANRELWDTPLFESESFIALPSVGALVPGWLLVVPRTEILSYSDLPTSLFQELKCFVDEVATAVQAQFGPVALFEHGPSGKTTSAGCGVDYAHLHVVPVAFDLKEGAKRIASQVNWQRAGSLADLKRLDAPHGYWYLQQPYESTETFIGLAPTKTSPSQLFRKVIANALGTPSAYDWKQVSGGNNIVMTVEALAHPLVGA